MLRVFLYKSHEQVLSAGVEGPRSISSKDHAMNDDTIGPNRAEEETLAHAVSYDEVSDEALEAAAETMSLSLSLFPCRCTAYGVHCR
jgi:hypothetical protein